MRIDKENQQLLQRIYALEHERNHHTAELIRVGTLLSANTLTTGLAHEIKNPLAGIQLAVSNLLRKLDKGTFDIDTLRAKLEKIQSNADRINERIGQARNLAEDTLDPIKPPTVDVIDIKQLFEHTLEGFQQQLSINEITVEVQVPADLPPLEANIIALEQVLANLLSNAIDALKEQGGTIRLEADFVEPDMVLTCHDTGLGIAPEHQPRLFEPLFTTKSRGQGTGIGLWLCKMIIEHWHGTIRLVSKPMQGTTFTITLPLKQEERG
jgi:signal transduction histidine kinase